MVLHLSKNGNMPCMHKNISFIESKRLYENRAYCDIVFEWEDELSKSLNLPLKFEKRSRKNFLRIMQRIGLLNFYQSWEERYSTHRPVSYRFEMISEWQQPSLLNKSTYIPHLIDFWVDRDHIGEFLNAYRRCPLIIASSAQVYHSLQSFVSERLIHNALSLPDKYAINASSSFDKKYKLIVLGRTSPVMMGMLDRYSQRHQSFEYLYRVKKKDGFVVITNKGGIIGEANSREAYMDFLRSSQITLYATPGIDGNKATNGYDPVTPRFLEAIACGCHVLARYPKNEDTEYYQLQEFSPHIENDDQFEVLLETALEIKSDSEKCARYLEKHYTSARAHSLQKALSQHSWLI